MKKILLHLIVAARPNFMKIAPLYHALSHEPWCEIILVHTGQHYDENMSDSFLQDLKLPKPHFNLGIGSGSHAEQTAGVMIAYEKLCLQQTPDWVIVVGDVNSTMACAITAKKLNLRVAHLEAGLRSRDMSMPEEINRIVTDAISDILWTPSTDADENLLNEGIPGEKIVRVGNIMMDSFEMLRSKIEHEDTSLIYGLSPGCYCVVTLHRPVNVDDTGALSKLVSLLIQISQKIPLVFPVHPRTYHRLEASGLLESLKKEPGIHITDPLGYIRFMSLVQQAKFIITDSGGVQEETTYLNIPCLTLRETTERPITTTQGTNQLVGMDTLIERVNAILKGQIPKSICPEFWDGHVAHRVVKNLREINNK
jgi:UDP-N-acetylglucosamine 2-epimerase (non-hydrolysing)